MSNSADPVSFAWTAEAIGAATTRAAELNIFAERLGPEHPGADPVYVLPTAMEIESILDAAARVQNAGDQEILDLQSAKHRYKADLEDIKADQARLEALNNELRLDQVELLEIQEAVRLVLKATKSARKRKAKYVRAWETLSRWAG